MFAHTVGETSSSLGNAGGRRRDGSRNEKDQKKGRRTFTDLHGSHSRCLTKSKGVGESVSNGKRR